jgi:excisionase family DNA binding protein
MTCRGMFPAPLGFSVLGVSVRTIDNCIAQKGIRVVRIGRRVLVPMHSIELLSNVALSKRTVTIQLCRNDALTCFAELLHQHIRMAGRVDAVSVLRTPFENSLHLLE